MTWLEHVEKWRDCQLCPLAQQRSNIVLARGTVPCDVLFVGEAPGQSEDAKGLPFVGPAGHLLDQIAARALPEGVTTAFTNLVCCFPAEAKAAGINEPEIAEIKACRPRLEEFIALAQPKLVVLVGTLADNWVRHDAYGRIAGAHAVHITHPAHILARLPQVQKGYAVNKCIAVIKGGWADVVK